MTVIGYCVSALFIILGLPLVFEAVAPNSLYGVRTAAALSDENSWYHINSIGGWGVVVSGVLSIMTIRRLKNNENLGVLPAIIAICWVPFLYTTVILGLLPMTFQSTAIIKYVTCLVIEEKLSIKSCEHEAMTNAIGNLIEVF